MPHLSFAVDQTGDGFGLGVGDEFVEGSGLDELALVHHTHAVGEGAGFG